MVRPESCGSENVAGGSRHDPRRCGRGRSDCRNQAARPRTWTGYYHDRKGISYRGVGHVLDLGCGMHSEQVAIVLDVLRNRLDPACRARALTALRAMTLDVYLELAGDLSVTKRHSCGWVQGTANWNAACNNYFVTAALRALDDPMERAAAIELAERSTRLYLGGFTEDGLSLEGASYWNYGFGSYLSLVLALHGRGTSGRARLTAEFPRQVLQGPPAGGCP